MDHMIAFIGGGNMGGAILRAVCRTVPPEQIVLFDAGQARTRAVAEETGCTVASDGCEAVRSAKFIMMCVKPQVFRPVLEGLLPALGDGGERVLVSIAAGVSLSALSAILGGLSLPLIRIMPNTPALVGKGTFLIAPDADVPQNVTDELLHRIRLRPCLCLSVCGSPCRRRRTDRPAPGYGPEAGGPGPGALR